MAKVDGPLFSLEARGKIADAMVFFPWKGRHVVRQWLKPAQKNSTVQGYVRASLSAIGKQISKILAKNNGGAVDSEYYQYLTSKAPEGMNWNAFCAQGFLNLLQSAGTFITGSFTDYVAAYSALNTAVLTAFQTNATALGLTDFAFDYGYTTNIPAGCQLFFGALSAYHNSLVASSHYAINPISWAASDVDNFKSDMTTAP